MAKSSLTFKQLKGRLALIDVAYTEPYGDGNGYFVGPDTSNRKNDFPYASGPRCFVGQHGPEDVIPLTVIYNWLHVLGIVGKPYNAFWAIEDHEEPSASTPK